MIRNAVRSLLQSPGFTLAAVITLALGIGANTAIFSLMNTLLLRPLPYPNPDRLVLLLDRSPDGSANDLSAANYQDWRNRSRSFEHIAAFTGASFNLTEGDRPERISGLRVTPSFLATLGVAPALGGTFGIDEEQPGAAHSVILSDALWRRLFGSNRNVVGSVIHLDRIACTVAGVMPPGFSFFGNDNELWAPLALDPSRSDRSYHNLAAIGRLRATVTIEQARAELDAIARQLAVEFPKTNQGWGASVTALGEEIVRNIRPAILILTVAVALVLLIACANVANLLLARGSGRRKEFAIRAALGAGRIDIVPRLLVESLLLSAAGGLLGFVLAQWSLASLVALNPGYIPRLDEVHIDWQMMAFAAAVSFATGVLFGLAPALQLSKLDINEALKEGGRDASDSRRAGNARSGLVIAETSLALVLLVGAGLLIRSFAALASAGTGFPTANVLTMNLMIPDNRYSSDEQMANDFERAVAKIQAIPGVASAASATNQPVGGWNQGRAFTIEGREPKSPGEIQGAGYMSVSPGYFQTLGLRIVRGREFTVRDRRGARDVVIVSESMARRFFPNEDPIGKRIVCASIQFGKRALGTPAPREIVGIVSDVRHVGHGDETSIEMYVPQMQNTIPFTFFIVRTASDAAGMAPAVARAVNEVWKDVPPAAVKTLDQRLAESFSRPRFQALVFGVFAAIALLLAIVGIYGVMAYSTAQRTQEIGIRMALGADAWQVLRMILAQGLKLALTGVVIGLGGAYAFTRLMSTLLYGVTPTDATTFASVSLLIAVTAALASLAPAWRAAKTDPAAALRGRL
jgi:putative ABC transport system permease protein